MYDMGGMTMTHGFPNSHVYCLAIVIGIIVFLMGIVSPPNRYYEPWNPVWVVVGMVYIYAM